MARQRYFHLAPVKARDSILSEGLRAGEDGHLYLFTDLLVADTIAKNQVFLDKYDVYEVQRAGITARVLPDAVGEFSRGFQRRIKQALIEPRRLKHVGTFDVVTDRPTEWDYLLGKRIYGHTTREQTDEWYAECRALWAALLAAHPNPGRPSPV